MKEKTFKGLLLFWLSTWTMYRNLAIFLKYWSNLVYWNLKKHMIIALAIFICLFGYIYIYIHTHTHTQLYFWQPTWTISMNLAIFLKFFFVFGCWKSQKSIGF
jgi:hypothetical protein